MQAVETQLARLQACFVPLHPITLKSGKPNPLHVAMRHEYHRCLEGFTAGELELGFDDLISSHKYQKWPSPAECQQACLQHHKRQARTLLLEKPEEPVSEFSSLHRAIMRRGCRNCVRWISSGEIQHRTAADAKRIKCDDLGIENEIASLQTEEIPF